MKPLPGDAADILATLALLALESPQHVRASTARTCESLLGGDGLDEEDCRAALLALAAVAYGRPDLISDRSVSGVESLLRTASLPDPSLRLAGCVLTSLMSTPVAPLAVEATVRGLLEPGCEAGKYETLIRALEYAAFWDLPLIHPAAALALSQRPHLAPWRDFLIERVIEPLVFASPESVTVPLLDELKRFDGQGSSNKYVLYYLAHRNDVPAHARGAASAFVARRFDLHEKVRRHLGRQAKRVLVVQNIKDGQGDEIIRCVPLIQALLDLNPHLVVTLVTGRSYLYAHPRLSLVSIRNEAAVAEALAQRSDAVVDFFEPHIREVNHDVALEERVRQHVVKSAPFLHLASRKGFNRFTYERVDIDGRPYAETLGLDRQRVENIYETTFRLAAELGLPPRSGEQAPVGEPVLAGLPWPEAHAAWSALAQRNTASRPVALLNPFGGIEPLKGYVSRKLDSLAERIRGLIEEGFYVVLLPNGTPWGSMDQARAAVNRLAPENQSFAVIAPDPAGEGGPQTVGTSTLSYADYQMRLVTYFVRFADLVVTVEGWMAHAAYCLGKRYRVLMLPYSHPSEWHPYGRTRHQDVVQAQAQRPEEGRQDEGGAPLPEQPRKHTLVAVLRELGSALGERALPFLRKALASEDRDVRLAATMSLAQLPDSVAGDLAALLGDASARVRAAAAEALLKRENQSLPLIEEIPRDQLLAHQSVGQPARNWAAVFSLGEAARPVLEFAHLKDDDPVIRREARHVLHLLDTRAHSTRQAAAGARATDDRHTSSKRRLLYVSPVIPDLTGNGLAMRAGMVLEALAGLYDVSLLVPQLYPPVRDTVPEAIARRCRAIVILPGPQAPMPARFRAQRHRRWFGWQRAALRQIARSSDAAAGAFSGTRFDVVHVFRLAMLPYARSYFAATDGESPERHLDLDDVESVTRRGLAALYRSNGAHTMAVHEEREAERCQAVEDEVLSSFDRVYVCSLQDRERLRDRSRAELCVLPNAVRVPPALPELPVDHPFTCLFVGTLGYYPNEDAVRYLCSEIVPLLRQRVGTALRVNIVGTGGTDSLRQAVATPGVQFIGAVPNVEDWYRTANIVVVPVRAGGGTRIKVLEAFAYRRPVVSTSIGIDGIDARDEEHLLVADTPASFADGCVRLLNDRALRERLTRNAFHLFLEAHTPDAMCRVLTRCGPAGQRMQERPGEQAEARR